MRSALLALAAGAALAPASAAAQPLPLPLTPCRPATASADGPHGLREYVGALHEHSAYSDGFPGSRPADYYRSGRCFGLNFLVGSEHSDNLDLPLSLNEECLPPASPAPCAIADKDNPLDSFRKWDAIAEQAGSEQTADFTTGRAFEWSSDRFGHINVYFSSYEVNAQADGSYADVSAFYDWAKRSPDLRGGGDGLLTFNHPGDKSLCGQVDVCQPQDDPGYNWDDFAYDPGLDEQMVGLETFNGGSDYGSGPDHGQPPEGWYAHALDRGWHVGAVGVEDKGHKRTDHWGADELAKTVFNEAADTRAQMKAAMAARRMYATLGRGLRLDFTVDGALMGSHLQRRPGKRLGVDGALRDWSGHRLAGDVRLDLVTNGGQVLASGSDTLRAAPAFTPPNPGSPASRWLFLRASREGRVVAYSSPVWIEARGDHNFVTPW